MRPGSTKPPGWGLAGGRMEFPNVQPATGQNLSITVKTFCLNDQGEVLLVNEKYLESKNQKTEQNFEQALIDMEQLIAHIQSKRSDITYDQVMRVLNEAVPKRTGLMHGLKRFFTAEEIGDRKIDPNLTLDWDPDSEPTKVILTAIREELEETGLLIKPLPLAEVPNKEGDHKIVVCFAEIVSGRLKQESRETWAAEWFSLDKLPPTRDEVNAKNLNTEVAQTMYKSHKLTLLPQGLTALLKTSYPLSDTVRKSIEQFLTNCQTQNPS